MGVKPYPARYLQGPIARIVIGQAETVFLVHVDIICEASSYFKADLRGDFKEAEQQECTLENVQPETFRHVVHWAYTRQQPPLSPEPVQDQAEYDVELCNLWILADRLFMPALRNATMDAIQNRYSSEGRAPHLGDDSQEIWENTRADSKLRLAVFGMYAERLITGGIDELRAVDPCNNVALDLLDHDMTLKVRRSACDSYCRYHIACPEYRLDIKSLPKAKRRAVRNWSPSSSCETR